MTRARLVCAMMSLALPGLPLPSQAWGPVGHKAVAEIAQSLLSPQTLQAVRDILGKDSDGKDVDLDRIANCADAFRNGGERLCAGAFEIAGDPNRSTPWHFINIPVSINAADAGVIMNYCPNGEDCVVAQIRKDMETLKDPQASRQAKQTALMYLVHFVGDGHQPLHCSDDNDAGGNGKPVDVQYRGRNLSLHQVWDHAIDDAAEVDYRENPAKLSAKAMAIAGILKADLASQDTASWVQGDLPSRMALESWEIAKNAVYADYAKDQGRIANKSHDGIGEEYRSRMQPIAYRRIELAGVRLAAMLEQALGSAQVHSRQSAKHRGFESFSKWPAP